jgi:hypothetical protein
MNWPAVFVERMHEVPRYFRGSKVHNLTDLVFPH